MDSTFQADQEQDDDDNEFSMNTDNVDTQPAPEDVQDFFTGDQAVGDDYAGMGNDDDAFDDEETRNDKGTVTQNDGQPAFVPFDPRKMPSERDFVLAMTEGSAEGMDYFDQTFLKNWSGPEHWKLRKNVVRRGELVT
jgi:condensin complex subunit 2